MTTRVPTTPSAADSTTQTDLPMPVRLMLGMERTRKLDRPASVLAPLARRLLDSEPMRGVLRGDPLGHALHPLLTDLPLGFWTSTSVLDLLGGKSSRSAAQLLLGAGLVSALPTAVTGVAEWGQTGDGESRVGVAHATTNTVALGLYTGSWLARRRGRYATGVGLALLGGAAATVGGYLGGHLTLVRKVSSRHPAFEQPAGG